MEEIKNKADRMVAEQREKDLSLPDPRTVFRSKWWSVKDGKRFEHAATYRKPVIEGEIKGKLARKAAKRARMKALKESQCVSVE